MFFVFEIASRYIVNAPFGMAYSRAGRVRELNELNGGSWPPLPQTELNQLAADPIRQAN